MGNKSRHNYQLFGDTRINNNDPPVNDALVLGCGRTYSAFVADSTKVDEVKERVGSACPAAVKRRLFVGTEEGYVVVGPDFLPVHFTTHNVRSTTSTRFAELVEGDASGEVPTETYQ